MAVTFRGADGKVRLGTRALHQDQIAPLAGTESAGSPFFSPDGLWIGFFAEGKLKKISVSGGAPVILCDARLGRGASWGDDGNIVFTPNVRSGLFQLSSAGGTPVPITRLDPGENSHRWPQVLPGSQCVLFIAHTGPFLDSYDDSNIDVVLLKTGERKTVQHRGFSPRYLATPGGAGHLIYLHRSTLFAAPFDLRRLALAGSPVPVLEDAGSSLNGVGDFAFAQTGTFVYLPGRPAQTYAILWLDSSGKTQPLHAQPAAYVTPRFSPDGKRLAFATISGQVSDIWVKDLERDTTSRLTFLPGNNNWPVWTPDGRKIVFQSFNPNGLGGLYWIPSDGSGQAQRLTDGELQGTPYSFSPDGKRLAFGSKSDIFTAVVEGDPAHPRLGKSELFLGTPFNESYPSFSPDGRLLAYASNESGTWEVYVRPFPGPGGRWQISTGGGLFPLWSRTGRELFFQTLDGRIMTVSYVANGGSFDARKPRVWSQTRARVTGGQSTYDLAPDGKRFAVLAPDDVGGESKPLTQVTFLLNFFDELERSVPSGK